MTILASQIYNMFKVYVLNEKQLEENGYPLVYNNIPNDNDDDVLLAYIPKSTTLAATTTAVGTSRNTSTTNKYSITNTKLNPSSSEIII